MGIEMSAASRCSGGAVPGCFSPSEPQATFERTNDDDPVWVFHKVCVSLEGTGRRSSDDTDDEDSLHQGSTSTSLWYGPHLDLFYNTKPADGKFEIFNPQGELLTAVSNTNLRECLITGDRMVDLKVEGEKSHMIAFYHQADAAKFQELLPKSCEMIHMSDATVRRRDYGDMPSRIHAVPVG
mmetsp:Transcript_41060/g.89503  ORF Transcript_41060/g.89503 Transcript_41060/m.89503 type:complete len:182 (-) Transcript_41060:21-566(-)